MNPRVLLVLLLFALASCTTPGPQRPAPGQDRALETAEAASRAGEHLQAAEAYLAAARRHPDRRIELGLKAAEAFMLGQRGNQAEQLLLELGQEQMPLEQSLDLGLLRAQLQIDRGFPRSALQTLPQQTASWMSLEQQQRVLSLRALAYADIGDAYASANQRIELAELLTEPVAWEENQRQILTTLRRLSPDDLRRYQARHEPQDPMSAWLSLAMALKKQLEEGGSPAQIIPSWEADFAQDITAPNRDWLTEYVGGFRQPRTVALLLPLNGRLAGAGRAIRDGFLAGYYADTGTLPRVRFYDTDSSVQGALQAFQQAQNDGAEQIVGPLGKPAIEATAQLRSETDIPMLALNRIDEAIDPRSSPFQFGLLPEDEARAVAGYMLSQGKQRAIALIPDNDWGQRVGSAFVEEYERLGGWVISLASYTPDATDHGAALKETLGLNAALNRQRGLARLLGQPLEFEANRRDDVDAVFLAARPAQARSIKPQLRFHRAGDLPVYATSHVYDGVPRPEQDRDLDGLVFCDSPWLLNNTTVTPSRSEAAELMESADGSRARLFALGMDAYRILPYLEWLSRFPNEAIPGATGDLSVGRDLSVVRHLDFARFRRGRPAPLAPREIATQSAAAARF